MDTTNAHALAIVQDAKTHRKLITTKVEHQTTNIKQTRESKHGHKTQTHPKHANEKINIYTAQVKPTTVAMAMWYRGQTATPLVALMINAIVRSLTGPGNVKNNLCRALMNNDTRPLVMTCADCGNHEPSRNGNHDETVSW